VSDCAAPGDGVSFVLPVYNGERWLDACLEAILAQGDGRPMEVIAVDDGSVDGSWSILERYAGAGRLRSLRGTGRGAAAALNVGIAEARHPIVCQVDQDVILKPGWMATLAATLAEPGVAAAQGYYVTSRGRSLWSRVMGLDLEQRYRRLRSRYVDHVCTGNSAYRAAALRRVGPFDESLGYGYDNDMSYRLTASGYRLVLCRDARSVHCWPDGPAAYLRRQYGMGYGRLDLVAKHRRRIVGDDISGLRMILHVPFVVLALLGGAAAAALAAAGLPWGPSAALAGGATALLLVERSAAGVDAAVAFRDSAGLAFPMVHVARDLAWAAALVVWLGHRMRGVQSRPERSMFRRIESTRRVPPGRLSR
jgi:GT2 family glycosyltransferase